MSLKIIREQILQFISQSTPSVMAIKGEWGVGKTFGWEALLSEAKNENMISAKRYSYVSLFGISSLDSLKYTIFENSLSKESIGNEPSLESLRTNTFGMLEVLGRGSWSKLKEMPFIKSAAPAIEAFSFMSISESLICLDDLERKGTNLDLKDVLGLVSLLRDKKKCKVILLLNAGEENTKDYEKYKEKVIDIELDFSPTPQESASIAYENKKDYYQELSRFTIFLGIRNIRVLTKIGVYVDLALKQLNNSEPELRTQVLQTTALFCWSYYCASHDETIPSLDFLESSDKFYFMDDKKLDEKEKNWKNLLLNYKFHKADELDLMIAKLVRHGYLERDNFQKAVVEINNLVINNKKSNSYRAAWDIFHNSFSDDETVVVKELHDAFLLNIKQLSPNELESLVNVLKFVGENDKASKIIDRYIDERRSEVEIFNSARYNFVGKIEDVEIIEKFGIAYDKIKPRKTIKEVLEKISGKNDWEDNDIKILSTTTENEFFEYFKSLTGPDLISHISTCLRFGGYSNGSEDMETIAQKAKDALNKIASESKLNEIRMRKFGL